MKNFVKQVLMVFTAIYN